MLAGGVAIDAYGTAIRDEDLDVLLAQDAVLLGAVGGPKWDDPAATVRPEQGLLRMRKVLGLYRQPAPRGRRALARGGLAAAPRPHRGRGPA